ncbi:MAG: NAD(P)/FAD-dependent oxidoreductase [Clostridia bacterium]|nr:NAD(P)/FAD-dependent oxidoreductase [Clostridia bacterium]
MRVIVIGAGASGLMASVLLARKGQEVVLLEKNEQIGKKILITGKGRCNVTNTATGEEFLDNVVRGKKFLISAERAFNSKSTMHFFEELGVKLKVERGNRVFPETDSAKTINNAFIKALNASGVRLELKQEVEKIDKIGACFKIKTKTNNYDADAVVVATGGLSYPLTGSTGDGYAFAKNFGHKIVETKSALNGVKIKGNECKALEGLSLKNVVVSAKNETGKEVYKSEIGEMLFTSVGISGPIVLSMSSYINREDVKICEIDFKPALSLDKIKSKIETGIEEAPRKSLQSLLASMLPKRLIEIMANRLRLDAKIQLNQLSRQKRDELATLLKHFSLEYVRVEDVEQSVITSGGVSLDEVSPKDMQSKIMPGLFFVGEVLDVDALTGGFNLQIAFSTASACANSKFFEGGK